MIRFDETLDLVSLTSTVSVSETVSLSHKYDEEPEEHDWTRL